MKVVDEVATIEQIKLLIKSHYDRNDERFKTTVLQIAASEAKAGHTTQARELKDLVDRIGKSVIVKLNTGNHLFDVADPNVRLSDMILSSTLTGKIDRIILEYRQREKLRKYGLVNRRRILIEGPSGTGKTMTASAIAGELSLQVLSVRMDKLISKFMGETSSKLREVFDMIEQQPGVYLFDEFDAIGADRTLDNEVGEMRRILNSFLQLIEGEMSDSIIIAATNNNQMLDPALYRRFDDVLTYSLPNEEELYKLFDNKLGAFFGRICIEDRVIRLAMGLSQAEISRICDETIKLSILQGDSFSNDILQHIIEERSKAYQIREA